MRQSKTARYLRAIERQRSLSAAAEELGISQPALSAYLKKIEGEVGATLFDRQRSPIVPTEAGRAYLQYELDVERLARELQSKISDINDLKSGRLVIGGATSFNVAFLPDAVAAFAARYPGVEIEIVDDTVPNIIQAAQNGEVDVFVSPAQGAIEGCESVELLSERIFVCVPSDWSVIAKLPQPGDDGFARIGRREFAQLCEHPFITLRDDQQIGEKLQALFDLYGCRPTHTIVTEQTLTSLALTLAGTGVSLATESTIARGNLAARPALYLADESICTRTLDVSWPKSANVSRAVSEFVRILTER